MWQDLFVAFCLLLVIEGMLPFLAPQKWRQLLLSMLTLSERRVRMAGFLSMLLGVFLLYLFN